MKISVIINNFNYAQFLRAAIESALHQTYAAHEVIVVDDGSTDGSREILAGYKDLVKVVLQENQGQGAALTSGFRISEGEVLCFLDSDDTWFPEKLASVAATFEAYPEVTWIRHKLRVCDERGGELKPVVPPFKGSRRIPPNPFARFERIAPVSTSALSLRRTLAKDLFPVPSAYVQSADAYLTTFKYDADAYIAASAHNSAGIGYSLDAILGLYRQHRKQQFTSAADLLRLIKRQIALGEQLQQYCHPSYEATHISKHTLILMYLEGRPRLCKERIRTFRAGAKRALGLWRLGGARLATLQLAKLSFALLAPSLWVEKLLRQSQYAIAPGSDPTSFKRHEAIRRDI